MKQEPTVKETIKEIDKKLDILYSEIEKLDNEPLKKNETFEEFEAKREPFYSQIRQLSSEKRMIMPYELRPLSDYGDVMSLKSFISACKSGMFIDYDGHGYYVKDNQETDIKIIPSDVDHKKIRKEFDTIIWFNK